MYSCFDLELRFTLYLLLSLSKCYSISFDVKRQHNKTWFQPFQTYFDCLLLCYAVTPLQGVYKLVISGCRLYLLFCFVLLHMRLFVFRLNYQIIFLYLTLYDMVFLSVKGRTFTYK